MSEGHKLTSDHAIGTYCDAITVAANVANSRRPHQSRARSETAGCAPQQTLKVIIKIHSANRVHAIAVAQNSNPPTQRDLLEAL
jgi:hypothetical protein